ncbi:MAG: Asp-tRNA(Asn)/Glu-tRNA(Gln) amidotransferase GatCAB subunit C [Candidatus Micrarchaeota archaeon]|nr:Asp-tRNA(Asn)/Glu-tRNA(Gln) amidotransferase GatCAB subunit C [Candidatus Micrarchaeota archaeon]MDE1804274.1 Asp-tRNA(Asn)/Glu-tRNA(Gln) amidotransferase GatCAB subunit C [Candidatus Micrarchaeota archaeon]MDE1846839.1 Asp-tRNA(Asn)/Glu-tRNA(Gln) amidotransferase GatCAB subunit C [Candidatus Micrarchaeota archaeon]
MKDSEFDRLLEICRLRLEPSERERIKGDIDEIIGYFGTLEGAEGAKAEPSYHPIKVPEKLREDKVVPFENSDLLLKGTKTHRFYVIGPDV